jgi:predicted nucleotidyltransferase
MELIKNTIKVGNSAGVLLPREWLGSQVRVILEPLNIDKEIVEILMQEKILGDVLGAYLVGSYARGEQTIESDIDILVITGSINKKIKKGKYEIICISQEEIKNQIEKNILPILPMIKEAKTIINKELIKQYSLSKLTLKNLLYHIETTKSAMKVVEKDIELSKEMNEKASDASAYSLILRLRTLYITECLKHGKIGSRKDFLKLVKNISGSAVAYERYLCSKNKNIEESKLPIEEAEKLMRYINKKIIELEKWLKEKKD